MALAGVAYLGGALLLAEVSSRVALSTDAVLARLPAFHAATWRLRWVQRHQRGVEITFPFDVYHPTRGWALRPNLRDLTVFDHKVLNTNSRGVRGTTEYPKDKAPGQGRFIVLGDSFTFGEEVSDDETYAARLGQSLPGIEILNLGVHGYGHDQMLLYLQEEGIAYHPDMVLVGFVYADAFRNIVDFRDFAKPRYVFAVDGLQLVGSPVPSPAEVLQSELWRPKLVDAASMLVAQCQWRTGAIQSEADRVTYALLDAIAATAQAAGAIPVFVDLPIAGPFEAAGERFLRPFCAERGYRCMSALAAFEEATARGEQLVQAGHWSPAGHRTAALAIREYLVTNRLVVAAGE
jgi:hypothetical protein